MAMEKIRLGSVGLGHRGRAMLQWAAAGIEGVEAVAVCDKNPDLFFKEVSFFYGGKHAPLKEEMPGIRFYSDYDEMLEKEKLDIVMVETPATCHAEFCAKALKKGIHVYSDIPSVANLQEADMLWRVQQESSAMLMTGATTCGWGFVLALQDLVRKGLLGKPFYLEAEYIHDCRPLWKETPWRMPGPKNHRYPITYCTHSLGPLLSILEEDLESVVCLSTGSHVTDIPEAEDLMTAAYRTASGVIVRQTNSFVNNCTTGNHSFRVFGTEGYFEHLSSRGAEPEHTRFSSNLLYGAARLTELPISFLPNEAEEWKHANPASVFGHGGSDSWLWHRFAEAVRAKAPRAPVDLRAGLRMTLPGIFAAESAKKNGMPVKIVYPWSSGWSAVLQNSISMEKQ